MTVMPLPKWILPMSLLLVSAILLTPESTRASSNPPPLALGPESSLGSPFGELTGVQGAMDAAGVSTLIFDTGPDSEYDLASRIERVTLSAAGAPQPPSVIATAAQRLSRPVLAVASNGRSAVAWFEEHPLRL